MKQEPVFIKRALISVSDKTHLDRLVQTSSCFIVSYPDLKIVDRNIQERLQK